GGGTICPSCGFNNDTVQLKGALPYATILQDRYCIGRVKCANSEGFTYAALDQLQEVLVDIREFFPATLVYRDENRVCPAENQAEQYNGYFNEFLDMARGLIRLKELSAVISVTDLFWLNNTAYIVYEHFDSVSLKSYLESRGGRLNWNETAELFLPMINSLSSMHNLGTKHLGISPETLRVCKDGKMRLSEFSIESVRRVGRGLTPDLVVGCPAYEQYTKNMECGEITDVYAFTACVLYVLTGNLPAGANKRMENQRLLISREILKTLPPHVLSAIASGLQVKQEERIGSFERLRAEFVAAPTVTDEIQETQAIRALPKTYQNVPNDRAVSPRFWMVGSFVLTAILLVCGVYYVMNYTNFSIKDLTRALDKTLETSALEVVTVPNMVGDSYGDWAEKMKDGNVYRFILNIESREFSTDVPEGIIIRQTPKAEGTIEKNGVVNLVISRGNSTRILPEIDGMPFTKALGLLEKAGFTVVREETYSESVAAENVQWYGGETSSGDELPYGSAVTVVVSLGKEKKQTE
ncbi:MAG: PASTA domain-containing protein, partial [Oscillospiraceae bacterium]